MRTFTKWTLLCASAFAGSAAVTGWANAKTGASSPYAALSQLARVLVIVENEYVEPVERSRLLEGAITGMVAELDPHSAYLPPVEYGMFQDDSEGRFGGIGVEVDFSDEVITIIAPIEGSPADRAGIRPGDRIVAIDNESVRGRSSAALVRAMRGKAGTRVMLTIRRDGVEKPLHFTVERAVIEVSSVRAELLKDDVLYLRVKQFQHGTHQELLENVAKLRPLAGGRFRGVLLDLRNNPGGLVDEAVGVADELMNGGVVFTSRSHKRVVDEARAHDGGALRKEPVVVLVNEFSASAAELVAGALQDHRRATVVGAPTFGKGSVQTILDLPGGAGLKLTTMRYYTPKGRAIQAQGIQPDVLVEASVARDKGFGVVREADLENHLPAEGPPGSVAPDAAVPSGALGDAGAPSPTHLGVARDVPHDPTGSADFALAIGYQIVRGVLRR